LIFFVLLSPYGLNVGALLFRLGVAVMRDRFPSDYFKSKAAEECSCESQIWLDSTIEINSHSHTI
jgi:hypothetical protein